MFGNTKEGHLGWVPRLTAAIEDLNGISIPKFTQQGYLFQCIDSQDDFRTYLADTKAKSHLTSTNFVGEIKEDGMLGVHHFIQLTDPPRLANGKVDRFNGRCLREDDSDANDHGGCKPFQRK